MRRSPARLLAVLAVAVVLLSGCSGGGQSATTAGGGAQPAAGGGTDADGPAADGGSGTEGAPPGGGTPEVPTSVTSGRVAPGAALVRTAELSVRVADVRRAADRAGRLAASAGGVVATEERSRAGEDGSALLVLRVPPGELDAMIGRLAELGEELDRRLSTTDVTEQVVDLDSRIATQQASVARVRALLDRARNLGEVVQIEGELTERTADLESLEARLEALEGQVDLSTITLQLSGEDGPALAGTGPRGFSDGLAAGWAALVAVGRAAGVTAGAVLPFTPLLLVAWGLVRRSRSRRATGPATTGPATTGPAPTGPPSAGPPSAARA